MASGPALGLRAAPRGKRPQEQKNDGLWRQMQPKSFAKARRHDWTSFPDLRFVAAPWPFGVPSAFASQAIVLARGRGKSAGWRQVASPAAAHPGVLCGRQAGDSSVGRASDCRMCSYQMVPGSIPGRRILLPSAKSMITGRSSEDECACSPAGQQWRPSPG